MTDRDEIYRTANAIKKSIGDVTILINNAGVVYGKTLLDLPDNEIDRTFQVNILAHYWVSCGILNTFHVKVHIEYESFFIFYFNDYYSLAMYPLLKS